MSEIMMSDCSGIHGSYGRYSIDSYNDCTDLHFHDSVSEFFLVRSSDLHSPDG